MLTLKREFETWKIYNGEAPVGDIGLDHHSQVNAVHINADAGSEARMQILRLAASHVRQYVRFRSSAVMGGLMVAEHRNLSLTDHDSTKLMDFGRIPPEVKVLTEEQIVGGLKQLHIKVITTAYPHAIAGISEAVRKVGVSALTWKCLDRRSLLGDRITAEFKVMAPNSFVLWKHESRPTTPDYLHIVPHYHPAMQGREACGMINGDTDAYIRGEVVRSIKSPKASRANRYTRSFGSSWGRMKHPYRACGRTIEFEIDGSVARSEAGVEELAKILRTALGVNNRYISVSGGFKPPLLYPTNQLNRIGRQSPYRGIGDRARGSESHCVWTHRVLTEEGVIGQAYVPSWFTKEDWLGIYKGAEYGYSSMHF